MLVNILSRIGIIMCAQVEYFTVPTLFIPLYSALFVVRFHVKFIKNAMLLHILKSVGLFISISGCNSRFVKYLLRKNVLQAIPKNFCVRKMFQ